MKKIAMSFMALTLCASFTSCKKTEGASNETTTTEATANNDEGNTTVFSSISAEDVLFDENLEGRVEAVAHPAEDNDFYKVGLKDAGSAVTYNFQIELKVVKPFTDEELVGDSLNLYIIPLDANNNPIEEQNVDTDEKLYWGSEYGTLSYTEDYLKEQLKGESKSLFTVMGSPQNHNDYTAKDDNELKERMLKLGKEELAKVKKVKVCLKK